MKYAALYRKFRPDNFDDVKGQEHIVTTLKNQVKSNRLAHAYLFCGTRGTGKTSIAKILAKSVNCESPIDGNPCNKCSMCLAINKHVSMNVIEIDAASNNGVDNIREIIDEVSYSPTEGNYKVYIIDEVHMLSIGAFNALLKTLEEPPEYVIFILATTEAHKIPITIMSRCQRYDFKRISINTISDNLKKFMAIENIDIDENALKYIAKTADGSMRDALSLLDRCIAFYYGNRINYDDVLEILGATDTQVFEKLLNYILKFNVTSCIELLEEIIINGRELSQFVIDFTWYLRNLLLVKTTQDAFRIIDVSSENFQRLQIIAQNVNENTLIRYIRIFSELSNQLKYSTQKRVMIEIALIKLCIPAMESDIGSILERLRIVEQKIEDGITINTSNQQPKIQKEVIEEKIPQLSEALKDDIDTIINNWEMITSKLDKKSSAKGMLKNVALKVTDNNILTLCFD